MVMPLILQEACTLKVFENRPQREMLECDGMLEINASCRLHDL
jgi:hypothetical protein